MKRGLLFVVIVGMIWSFATGCQRIPKTFTSIIIDTKLSPKVTNKNKWLFPIKVGAYKGTKINTGTEVITIKNSSKWQTVWADLTEAIGNTKLSSLRSNGSIYLSLPWKIAFVNGTSKTYNRGIVLDSRKLFHNIALGKQAFPTFKTNKHSSLGKQILLINYIGTPYQTLMLRKSELAIKDLKAIAVFESKKKAKKMSCGPYVRKVGGRAQGKPFHVKVNAYKQHIRLHSLTGKKIGEIVEDASSCPRSYVYTPTPDGILFKKGGYWRYKVEGLLEKYKGS